MKQLLIFLYLLITKVEFSFQSPGNLEVHNISSSRILIKYKGRPLNINFTELSNGKIRIQINDLEDDDTLLYTQDNYSNLQRSSTEDAKEDDKALNQKQNNSIENEENYHQIIIIGILIFTFMFILTTCFCIYFYVRNKRKMIKKAMTDVDDDPITISGTKCETSNNGSGNKSLSYSTASTLPNSHNQETSFSSTYTIPKLDVVKNRDKLQDTSSLVSIQMTNKEEFISKKTISTIANGLAYFALEAIEREPNRSNSSGRSVPIRTARSQSEMLTEQYLRSSLSTTKPQGTDLQSQVKTTPLQSKIIESVRIGDIKTDKTQDSLEEKNSKSDPKDNSNSSLGSSKANSASSIHFSDLSTKQSSKG
uniref:Uncharacterized protein n=1 Tax=Parastrongyloides trichosuri TaxID=131310 RepID=A0A0N5A1M5_PARTI